MSHTIKIVIKHPHEHAQMKEIEPSLEMSQSIVGGYIEQVHIISGVLKNFDIICNEEGRFKSLLPNIYTPELCGGDIVGTFFVTKVDGRNSKYRSLRDDEIAKIIDELNARSCV